VALSYKTILVPVDFTPRCAEAARDADALALGSNGQLVFFHVHTTPIAATTDAVPIPAAAEQLADALSARRTYARRWVEELGLVTKPDHIRIDVVEGMPADSITERSKDADLIVIASHGRRGLSRWLLGSVAERVVRGAHCSTLVVRGTEASE